MKLLCTSQSSLSPISACHDKCYHLIFSLVFWRWNKIIYFNSQTKKWTKSHSKQSHTEKQTDRLTDREKCRATNRQTETYWLILRHWGWISAVQKIPLKQTKVYTYTDNSLSNKTQFLNWKCVVFAETLALGNVRALSAITQLRTSASLSCQAESRHAERTQINWSKVKTSLSFKLV